MSQPSPMQPMQKVVVIGAGGSGLSVSYHLTRLKIEHTVLERSRATRGRPSDGTRSIL
ncbi:MAG: NAD-binding protein [Chloroflexi bacterium]|nr:NAD-binding protein [Chloroflexota bacterium]